MLEWQKNLSEAAEQALISTCQDEDKYIRDAAASALSMHIRQYSVCVATQIGRSVSAQPVWR